MKRGGLYVAMVLLGAWFPAYAAPQLPSGVATTNQRSPVVESESDYAVTLKDPFSPIGYRLPMSEWQAPVADAAAVTNSIVLPPSIDLKTKAQALLRVRGIVKRGNKYVANINGAIVNAGDEVNVTVDGQTVVFVIRTISLKRVQIDPRE